MDDFKFFFILIFLIAIFYLIFCFILNNQILPNILDDTVFLSFRMLTLLLLLIALIFNKKWRTLMDVQNAQASALNNNLQEQIMLIDSSMLLTRIEKNRGRLEAFSKLPTDANESSARVVLGAVDFSHRGLVDSGSNLGGGGNGGSRQQQQNFNN